MLDLPIGVNNFTLMPLKYSVVEIDEQLNGSRSPPTVNVKDQGHLYVLKPARIAINIAIPWQM